MIIAGSIIDNVSLLPLPNYPFTLTADSLSPPYSGLHFTDTQGNFSITLPNASILGQNIFFSLTAHGCGQSFNEQTSNFNGAIDSTYTTISVCVSSGNTCQNGFQFSNNPYGGLPLQFQFSDSVQSSSTIYWLWSFDNADTIQSPASNQVVYTFSNPGNHLVCLTTLNQFGCLVTNCDSVTSGIPGSCIASIQTSLDTSNFTAIFTLGINPSFAGQENSYTLNFGDGDSAQFNSIASPVIIQHIYPNYGTYAASVSVINAAGCADTAGISVVFPLYNCVADFFYTPISTPPGSIYFTNLSSPGATQFTWDFGDGSPTDTTTSPLHIYLGSGTFNVCLTATYPNGCVDTHCGIANVSFTPPCNALFSWFADPVAGPNGIQLNNLSTLPLGGTYSFNAGDGSPTFILPNQTLFYNYPSPGTYYSCLNINGPNCIDSYCDSIIILSSGCTGNLFASQIIAYTATFSSTFNPFVSGDTLTIQYNFGDGTLDTITSQSANFGIVHTFQQAGNYQVCAQINANNGCSALVCTTLVISPYCEAMYNYNPLQTGPPGTFIFEDSSISGASISNWNWSFNGSNVSGPDSLSYLLSLGYNDVCLNISTVDGCQDTYCDSVFYSPPTGCTIIIDSVIVPNTLPGKVKVYYSFNPSVIGEILSYEYQWGDGTLETGTLLSGINQTISHPYIPGNYTACFRITNAAGCADSVCVQINYQPSLFALEIRLKDVLGNNLNDMTIVICRYDTLQNKLVSIDTSQLADVENVYFKTLPFGSYLIKGSLDPSNPLSSYYLPTYYGNQLYWNAGVLINQNGILTNLTQNYFPVFINLITGTTPIGSSSINGMVHENFDFQSAIPMPAADVFILSNQGAAINHTKTDNLGMYSFSNLPSGSYFVYPELLNHTTYPVEVNLSNGQVINNVNLGVQGLIIQGFQESANDEIRFFPNPANSEIMIIPGNTQLPIEVVLFAADGTQLLTKKISNRSESFSLDLTSISDGLYWLKCTRGDKSKYHKLLVVH